MQQVTEKRDLSSVSEVGLSEHPTCELRVFSNVKGRKRGRKQRRDQVETGNVILNSPGARALTPSRRRPRNAMAARMGYAGYAGPARPQGHTSARSMPMRRAEARARGGTSQNAAAAGERSRAGRRHGTMLQRIASLPTRDRAGLATGHLNTLVRGAESLNLGRGRAPCPCRARARARPPGRRRASAPALACRPQVACRG